VTQKQSLRAVSVELGIDMKRIAAVVRLVELEKRQRSQVRISFSSLPLFLLDLPSPSHMMSQKNSISLEDTDMVTTYLF
jgi:hypothetical protein